MDPMITDEPPTKEEKGTQNVVDADTYDEWKQVDSEFSETQRRRLTRKADLLVLSMLTYYYLLAWIDRGNAGNAKLFGLLEDLRMTGHDFNLALMEIWQSWFKSFFFTYAAVMIPTQYLVKRLSPSWVFPSMLVGFGVITIATGFCQNKGGFVTCRVLLGLCEGGYFPGQVLVVSYWYDKKQIQKRIAVFYTISAIAAGFAGFIAYGVGELDYANGYRAWRYLYWIEGGITTFSGLVGYILIATWPKDSRILTKEESRFVSLRLKYLSARSANSDEGFQWRDFRSVFVDPKIWCSVLNFFCGASTQYGVVYVLPSMVKSLGYTAQRAQALTGPPYVFAGICCFCFSIWGDKREERMLTIIIGSTSSLLGFIIVFATLYYPSTYGVTYFACFIALGGSYIASPALSTWVSVNTAGHSKRAISLGFVSGIGTMGGVAGSNFFLESEVPTYKTGFSCIIVFYIFLSIIPCLYCRYYVARKNRERDQMDEMEIRRMYSEKELEDMGDDSPLFRYTK